MIKRCAVCSNPCEWQGMLNPMWKHVDRVLDAEHAAIYVAPIPKGCCGQE